MKPEQWETIQKCADMQAVHPTPVGLIVDSPWIPGYLGISTLDYLMIPEIWLQSNLEIMRRFPEIIFLPGFWVEMGMAAEPSGYGCKVSFYADKTPAVHPMSASVEEAGRLRAPNPIHDGLMPLILSLYRWLEPKVKDAGRQIKIVAARGPLATAAHLVGVTNFLLGLKLDPENTHRLLRKTTATAKQWLQAQTETLSEVEGVMLLDDIAGFVSEADYLAFAHPYLKEIFDAFPGTVKLFHNDMDNPVSYPHLWELPVHIFNFTHLISLGKARKLVGPKVCLMGNVAPLDVLTKGTPELALEKALACLESHSGDRGLILSAGGGVSTGTPGENVAALVKAVEQFNKVGR
ncbi:MAG: uroporphyrinogen decarboxylase family protein [Anaerolineales bacterium]|nr:uroporphyrinogen decarboxylase family protein [Anaerolineales bacterium]